MKKELAHQKKQFSDAEHEQHLHDLRVRTLAHVELQAKQNGSQNKPVSVSEHQALILNYISVTMQSALDRNQQKFLPVSGIAIAKFIEADATKKILDAQRSIDNFEHDLQRAKHEAQSLRPDLKLIVIRRCVNAGLVFIACTEGLMSYDPFRRIGFSTMLATADSVGVAISVWLSAHFGGGFVKQANNWKQTIARYAFTLVFPITGFTYLAQLRANALNHSFNPTAAVHDLAACSNYIIAASIAGISILLYILALILSCKFYLTDAERKREQQYEETCTEVDTIVHQLQQKEQEVNTIITERDTAVELALQRWEYAYSIERSLVTFASEAAEHYKQANIRSRTDGCPVFYAQLPCFTFTTFFNNRKTNTNENVQ